MKITTKVRLAMKMLSHMNTNIYVRAEELAFKTSSSKFYVEQLMRKLRVDGIVASGRGPGGGFVLAKPLTAITLGEVFEAVGEKLNRQAELEGTGLSKFHNDMVRKLYETSVFDAHMGG